MDRFEKNDKPSQERQERSIWFRDSSIRSSAKEARVSERKMIKARRVTRLVKRWAGEDAKEAEVG